MTTVPTIAVTGATGHVGGLVARDLATRGLRPRLVVRDPARAPVLPGATVVPAAYADRAAARVAFDGVDVLLLVSASEDADRLEQHRTVVEAAAEAGVGHVVYTSFLGAAPDATFTLARDHAATEQHIRDVGLRSTVLRDSLYADFLPFLAGDDDVIRGPAGDGRVAPVARADVAAAAVAVLLDPEAHAGATYDLTGPDALSLVEVADLLTRATGRPVRYRDETLAEAYASRARYGAPAWQMDAWVSTYTAIARGELDVVGDGVPRLTGRPATSVPEVLARAAGTP